MAVIAAIASPPGEGAVALLRMSGPGSHEILARLFRGTVSVAAMEPRRAYFGRVVEIDKSENETVVDEVLVTTFRAPASYTGEDMVEIGCHGGILITAKILELLLTAGARSAEPGGFTLRAFLGGKMDLTQAEAVMDLIRARTPVALRAAAEQMNGRIGRETEAIRASLLRCVAHLEAHIDFPEEGIEPATGGILAEDFKRCAERIRTLLATADEGRILREGVRLAIYGNPNAGKSSLLNRLLGFERAIVNESPGTTRDTIEESASLRGIPFRITDTAGIRAGTDAVETEGVDRARKAAAEADIILRVIDAADPAPPPPFPESAAKFLDVFNKIDRVPDRPIPDDAAGVSCKTGQGIDGLVDRLVSLAGCHHLAAGDSPAAINARHQTCLARALKALETARAALNDGLAPELVAVDLRAAMDAVAEVAGRVDTEDILGEIFGSFCIGK